MSGNGVPLFSFLFLYLFSHVDVMSLFFLRDDTRDTRDDTRDI